jgi:Uma2 family endonuclease
MTADEFFADPDVPEFAELVDGEVHEVTPAPPYHGWIGRAVFLALHAHAAPRQLGEVFGDGVPYQLGPHTVRVPDVSFIRADRVPGPPPRRGAWRLAPDLAVEVLSPSDTRGVLRKKLADYFGAGTPIVWLVDPDDFGVEVLTPDAAPRWIDTAGALDGGPVLPDLRVPVADLSRGLARDG